MFRIFFQLNALFVVPHIRGAIREYQTQLIQRVEDVLGQGWANHVEGQKLKADGDSFWAKLNTQEIFNDWARKVQQRNLGVSGRIIAIENIRVRSCRGNQFKLKVNFLPEIIHLSKEVRILKNLDFRVPLAIMNTAHQANKLYPFAISLIESVRIYERSLENITLLVVGLRKDEQQLVMEGCASVWESYKLDPYIQRLAEMVVIFQEKVDDLLVIEEEIDLDVQSLKMSTYSANTFGDILNKIQKAVDDLNLHAYSNLHAWVANLDESVETKLAGRLDAGIRCVLILVSAALYLLFCCLPDMS